MSTHNDNNITDEDIVRSNVAGLLLAGLSDPYLYLYDDYEYNINTNKIEYHEPEIETQEEKERKRRIANEVIEHSKKVLREKGDL